MKKVLIGFIIVLIALIGLAFALGNGCGISSVEINGNVIYVETADNAIEQREGLMFRENLGLNNGMLFVYDDERTRSFWMKNTLIPLDMIFIDSNFVIVEINENAIPCGEGECIPYQSKQRAKYVLEVNAGYVEANGILIGDKVKQS